ncbi:hypothetical protein ACVWWO_003704 [Bradyrhizobium sp. F1.13.1]
MKATMGALALALAAATSTVSAQPVRWTRYTIPQTGTSVDFPSSIFTEEAGRPDAYGQRFRTAAGRADLTIQAAPNLAKKIHPPPFSRRSTRLPAFSTNG